MKNFKSSNRFKNVKKQLHQALAFSLIFSCLSCTKLTSGIKTSIFETAAETVLASNALKDSSSATSPVADTSAPQAQAVARSPYGIPAKLIFMQAKRTARTCASDLALDIRQELSDIKKLRELRSQVYTELVIDLPVATITSILDSQKDSITGLRIVMGQFWRSAIMGGYRGLNGDVSDDVVALLDLPWGTYPGTIYLDSPLKQQINFFKSINYQPVITPEITQKLALLDSYDARLTQLIALQTQVFQSLATKVDQYANCKIQTVYPRMEMDLASLPLNDIDLQIEKYAPQGLFPATSGMPNEISYQARFPNGMGRNLYTAQASFLASDLFGTLLTNKTFNLNGIKSELMNSSSTIKSQFQSYMSAHIMGVTYPNLKYHNANYDPAGQDQIASLLGMILSPNAGNATIWSSIQRLGINYSVNVYKQKLQAACGFSCPVLNQNSIIGNAIDLSSQLSSDPFLEGSNYNQILEQFKMRVVNQNLLARVLSEARSQAMFYFATRILVSRKWMDVPWFSYARSSGMVQENWVGNAVYYVGIMDINLVLYQMLYMDGPVAHALDAQQNPVVKNYFDHLMAGLLNVNLSSINENAVFAEIGKRIDTLQKMTDEGNQVFADGYLVN